MNEDQYRKLRLRRFTRLNFLRVQEPEPVGVHKR